MKYSDLIQLKNSGGLEINEQTFSTPRTGMMDAQIASIGVSAGVDAKAAQMLGSRVMRLSKADAGSGLWIPYLAGRTVYGYLSGGKTWAASGPFSGCYFEVGRNDGQIYVAHISCESSSDPNVEAWKSVLPGRTVLFSAKMSMSASLPAGATNAAAIAFASINGATIEVTRVDVQTASAGGMTGPVFDVQLVANAA